MVLYYLFGNYPNRGIHIFDESRKYSPSYYEILATNEIVDLESREL